MAIYRFKVTFENYDDVWREIDIRSDQTFEEFFYAIQQSIGFDNQHEASFYISNDQWKLGQQISSNPKHNTIALKDAVMHDWVNDPHQKIYYSYDPKNDWTFFIELVRILMKEDLSVTYPACVKVYGDSPVQYIRQPAPASPPDAADKLLNELLKGIHIREEIDQEEYGDETTDEEEELISSSDEEENPMDADSRDSDNEPSIDEDDDQREY
ncbi:MAG: hypothetical protein JNL47_07090 [Bacteroidia bacterium]|nr:hypothetical protein [Bacteroidia bacterium]